MMLSSARLDRLSAVLEGLAPQINVREAGAVSPPAAFVEADDLLRLHLVTQGSLWINIDANETQCLAAPAIAVFRGDHHYRISPAGGADEARQMTMEARFGGPAAAVLLEAFASPLLMSLGEAEAELDLVVRLIDNELAQARCGQSALLARAGDILFIGLLRHLIAHPRTDFGLLSGLSDPRIARAIVAIHSAPHRPWTLDTLALEAGMSRTAFAVTFRERMSCPPGSYLARLRLSIASRAIRNGQGLKRAAREAGYASTTALSRALARMRASEAFEEG